MREAVITGLGVVAPNGIGKDKFWDAITSGRSGIRRISKFEPLSYPCQVAGQIPPEWLEPELHKLPEWLPDSMSCKLIVIAALDALGDAGLSVDQVSQRNSAIYIGVSTTDMEVVHREYETFKDTGTPRPDSLVSAFPHTPAAVLSHVLKSYNNVVTLSTACTSGLNSVYYGASRIIRGEADIVITGGVDTPLSPLVMAGFCSAGMVPTAFNEAPEEACRPFDSQRQGGILSEGAGVVIMEEKQQALRRGATIYAVFSGGGLSTSISPRWMKSSLVSAMACALEESLLKPQEIDYICACAPGDPVIDQVETEAIREVFGLLAFNIPVSSIKSMIGNPGAAAGPIQVITAALSIEKKFIPPTVNLEEPSAGCDLDYVPAAGRVARVNRVLTNLRGFGGGVSSVVVSSNDR